MLGRRIMTIILKIWVLLLILQTGSVLYINYNNYISTAFIAVSLIIVIRNSTKLVFKRKEIIILLLYYLLLLLSASIAYFETEFISVNLITYLAKITIIFLVLKIMGWEKFLDNFSRVILWLMFISSIIFIIVLTGINLPMTYGVIGEIPSYFYLLRTTGVDFNVGFNLIRNSGPFYEPGLYQVLLNFALLYYYLIRKKTRISLIIFAVVVSTLSPIGILISGIIISSKYWNVIKRPKSLIPLVLIITVLLYFIMPFIITKTTSLSFQLRMYDLKSGIKLFLEKPFFGLGFENHNLFLIDSIDKFGISRKNSNGLLNLMIGNGMFFSTFYIFLLFRGFLRNTKSYIWLYVAVIQLVAQPLYLSSIFMVFIAFGIIGRKLEKKISGSSVRYENYYDLKVGEDYEV